MDIYIWGAGRITGKVVGRHIKLDRIKAFIDNDKSKKEYMGKKVISPEDVAGIEYDAILVANLFREQIYNQCIELGICLDKVIFLYNNCVMTDVNKDYSFIEKILGKEYADIIKKRYHLVRSVESYGKPDSLKADLEGYQNSDYVRIECFQLAVKEIYKRRLCGAVAEVGVFRGEFAKYINGAFPDRKCYLFDTFEGFNVKEALEERRKGNCTDAFIEAYKQTNLATVLECMPHLDSLIIKQGYFPQSLDGLEEIFAFVSLDMDFEESIYEGLKYFYPRLERGGYIFVHDYNSSLLGVEKAVDRYEKELGIVLCKVPVCDANGTLVITKGSEEL